MYKGLGDDQGMERVCKGGKGEGKALARYGKNIIVKRVGGILSRSVVRELSSGLTNVLQGVEYVIQQCYYYCES